jgi:hypothetical protein
MSDTPPLRVAQIIAGAPAGGAELFYERLTAALACGGDAVLPVIRRNAQRAARLRSAGMAPVQLGFGGPFDVRTTPRLRETLRRFAPRVAIAWMSRAAQFTPKGEWVLAGRLGGYYDLRNFRHCDHLIGNTNNIVEWIRTQGWPAERTHLLPNFAPDLAGATPVLRSALGVPIGVPWVLALGRLHRNKAFDLLVRALGRLPGVHAVIAGEGPERAALESLARSVAVADRLHLPGWRPDTAQLLAGCDLLVCPSRQEPLGNVVLEAWSAGRPVVAAAAAGPRELIRSGEDGLLVTIEDAGGLADAMRCLLDDHTRAAMLARGGRARYETDFAEAPVLMRWRAFLANVEKS